MKIITLLTGTADKYSAVKFIIFEKNNIFLKKI